MVEGRQGRYDVTAESKSRRWIAWSGSARASDFRRAVEAGRRGASNGEKNIYT